MSLNSDMLNLQVGVSLNTKEAQDSLQNFIKTSEKTTKIKIGGVDAFKTLTTYVDKAGNSVERTTKSIARADGSLINISDNITRLSTKFKDLKQSTQILETQTDKWMTKTGMVVTNIKTTDASGETLNKRIREYTDAQGYAVKETQLLDEALRGLGKPIIERTKDEVALTNQQKQTAIETAKLAQAEKERMANVSKTTTYNKQMIDGHKALVKTIEEIDNKGQKTTTTIAKYKNELGQTVTVTNKFDEAGNKMQGTITEIDGKVKSLGASFLETMGKVAKFYVATIPIQMVQTAITETIETVKEFNDAFVEMSKVSSYSGEQLRQYTKDLANLGEEVGRTATEMTDMTTGWLKAGYSEEDASKLAKYSA